MHPDTVNSYNFKFLKFFKHKIKLFSYLFLKKWIDNKYLKNHVKFISFLSQKISNIRIVNFTWLDTYTDCRKELLQAKSDGFAYSPKNKEISVETKVQLPDIYAYHLNDIIISCNSSSLIKGSKIIIEKIKSIDHNILSFKDGSIIYKGKFLAMVKLKSPHIINKGFFLCGNGCFNYYHWLIEILPKLEWLDRIPIEYPLLVSEDVMKIKNFKEILDILVPGRELIYLSKEKQYLLVDMIYITTPNNIPFNQLPNYKLNAKHFLISSSSIKFIRDSILKQIFVEEKEKSFKIFLKRKEIRRLYNQDEVERILLDRGFTSIKCEDLSFIEQVTIFNKANFIIGPTGAAWTNIIFSKSGAKSLCWMPQGISDFSAYSTLAKFAGVDLRYIYYNSDSKSTGEFYHKDYNININDFKNALHELFDEI